MSRSRPPESDPQGVTELSAAPLAAPARAATTPVTFAELGVPQAIADRLRGRGITEPFPIQIATLGDALAGRDVCGKAPTGSGKTIAFGIPLVTNVSGSAPRRPRGLVLVPTRELATQVHDELVALAGRNGPRVATFFGGVGFGPQLRALGRGVDIAVACPGRLADLVNQGEVHLDAVEVVVLDEADRMADMGFLPEVTRLLDRTPADRQTLLFSATLDGAVDVLVRRYQRDPVRHEHVVDDGTPQNRHEFWAVERADRIAVTARLVQSEWPAMVFCRTRRGADRVARQLAKEGVSAAAIHGDRSQAQRERALAQFSSGRAQALVATDVAARGIHVDDVRCVVHFDVPADDKDYVHRSGRTGRAGATGLVVTLVPAEQVKEVRRLQRILGLATAIEAPPLDDLAPAPPAPVTPASTPAPRRSSPAAPQGRRTPRGRRGPDGGQRSGAGNDGTRRGPRNGGPRQGGSRQGGQPRRRRSE
jgi:superfamily II DNA/RNA helicase